MSQDQKVPALFPWGYDGLPGELDLYVRGKGAGVAPGMFDASGVGAVAEELADAIEEERHAITDQPHEWPRVPEYAKQWAYLLHAYCRRYEQPAPAALLRLTFLCLSLSEGGPAPEINRDLGLPADVRNHDAFLEASRLDGEADAAGTAWSVNALARALNVTRDTIRRWRDHPSYQQRRGAAAQSSRYWRA